jgi:PAS domain S-box-containing protein
VGEHNPLERVRDVCAFMALGGVVSCLSSATIGVTTLCLAGFAPWSAYGQTWLTWWLGDTAGVFIVAPLFLVWGGGCRWKSAAHWVELFVSFGLLIAVTYYVFVVNTTVLFTGKPLTFALIPFLVWLAVRFGRRGAATAAGLIALLAVWGTIRGSGPFNLGSRNESLLALELFLSVISLTALSIAVVVTERRQAESDRRRVLDELESRVAERTGSLHQANAALRESEARFTAFMDHLPGHAWMKDLAGRYTYANETLSQLEPYRAAWRGKTDFDLWPSETAAIYRANDEAVIATGKTLQTVESYFLDGKASHLLVSKFPIRDATGAVVMVGGAGIDITERKAAEEKLSQSLALLRAITEGSTDAIYAKDWKGKYLVFNTAAAHFVGKSTEEVIGLDDTQLFSDETLAKITARDRHILESGETRTDEEITTTASGNFRVYLTTKGPLRDSLGAITGLFGVSRDITERKRAEEALAAQVTRYRTLMETSTDSIYVLDQNGDLQEANAAFLRRRGYTAAEVKGFNVADWDAQWTREQLQEKLRELVGGSAVLETRHRCKDGSIFDVEVCATSVLIGGEQLFFVVTRDISERKQAEDLLRRSEEKFKALFGIAPVGISVLDRQHNMADANPALERIMRLSREQLLEGAYRRRTYLNADGTPKPTNELPSQHAVAGDRPINDAEVGIVAENGEIIWTLVSVAPLALPEVSAVVITQDITERKHAEQALRESEERFRELAENINEVFWMWTATPGHARCLYVSPAYETIWGRSCESLYASPQSWKEALHPQDEEWVLEGIAHLDFEKISDWTYRIVRPDQSIRWIRDRIFPVRDVFGAVVRFAGIAEDITERRIAEEDLKKEKEILAKVFDNIPVMIGFVGADGVKRVNPEWERTMGWTLKELQDQNVDIFVESYPDLSYRQEVLDFVAAATGEWADLKIKVRDGRVIDAACAVVHLSDGTKVAIAQDITERKQAEQGLRESEERFRELAENINEVFWVWTATPGHAQCLYVSPAYATIWGRSCQSLYSSPQSWMEALHPQDKERVQEEGARMAFEKITDWTYRIVRPDQSIRWIRDRIFPVRDARGAVVRFAGIAEDITDRKRAEQALRESQERLQSFFAGATAGLCILDEKLRYVRINETLADMNGAPVAEHLGRSIQEVLPAIAPVLGPLIEQVFATGKPILDIELSGETPREPGVKRHWIESMFPIVGVHDQPEAVGVIAVEITASKRAKEALDVANRQLQVLSRRRVEVQEDERRHLSRELHDQIGQALTVAKINLQTAQRLRNHRNVVAKLKDTAAILDQILQQVRRISLDLRPPALDDLGLAPALRWTLHSHAELARLAAEFIADPELQRMDPETETACFRVALEALSNVIRHARARKVSLELRCDNAKVHLIIRDDGIGFDVVDATNRTRRDRLGLVGMEERATVLGGTFQCKSTPGGGTEVHASFPIGMSGKSAAESR